MAISYNVGVTAGTKVTNVYGGGTSFRFVPTFWSAKFVEQFYNVTFYDQISNTDYQGEIKGMGDKVIIPMSPTVAISDYAIGDTLTYERPSHSTVILDIDRAKKFTFQTNDVEKLQSKPNYVAKFSESAAEQMRITIDADVLDTTYLTPHADNVGATAGVNSNSLALGATAPAADGDSLVVGDGTSSTVDPYVILSRMATVLDEQNVPDTGRYAIVSPQFRHMMQMSPKALAFIQGGDQELLRKSYVGMVDRFKIFVSNQVPAETVNTKRVEHIIAGHPAALTFASQMTQMEQLRNPTDFGDLVRGLNVYGFKTVNPLLLTQASVRYAA